MWGFGRASAKKLEALGLNTVADLAAFDVTQGREALTVTGARVIMELQGEACHDLSLISPQRKGLAVTRTFGESITQWDELKETISTFASRAGEKLREHGLLACAMTVFIQTNRFKQEDYYSNVATFGLEPTQDSFALFRDALRGTPSIFRRGYRYWKAGVMLNDLLDATTAPVQMFPSRDPVKSAKLMATMDGLNGRFGRGMVRPAVSGIERRWKAKAEHLSPRYTTRLDELVSVHA